MNAHPARLGKYNIVRVIGTGAMGVVYEGFDPIIERTLAIKTIRKDSLDPEEAEEHARRFLIEARAAGKLNHANIVAIYDFGDEQGQSYIAMEFVEGKELKSFFDAKHVFTPAETLRLVSELLDALGYSHRQGVIHRDVKPANLFVTSSGSLKLGDFGIARIDSSQKTHDGTMIGTALGTPSYMSPEQVRGETADARSDLYSVGVILYQFLTGEKPFTGSMVAVMQKVLNEAPPPPSAIDPGLSPAVDAIVARALAKAREDRFQSAEAFREALEEALGTPQPKGDAEATLMIRRGGLRARRLPSPKSEPASSEITAGSASRTSGSWVSASWVGTSPGDSTGEAAGTGLSELRRRAEEAQRKAQEKMRRAERDVEIAEHARQEREQAAQSRFKELGEAGTAQLGSAAELADAARSLLENGALLIDGDTVLQQLQTAIEAVDARVLAIVELAGEEALTTTAKSEAEALCAWLQEETDRLRETRREVGSRFDTLRQSVEQRLDRLDALDDEGRRGTEVAQTRLRELSAVCEESEIVALERDADNLRALARRCESELSELGRIGARLPPAQERRLRSAAQTSPRLAAAADAIAETAVAKRRQLLDRLQAASVEAERRALTDEQARIAAESVRQPAAEALVAEQQVERGQAPPATATRRQSAGARPGPANSVSPVKWLAGAGSAALLIGGVAWYVAMPSSPRAPVSSEAGKPAARLPERAAMPPNAAPTIETGPTEDAAKQAAASAARAEQEKAAARAAASVDQEKAAATARAEQERAAAATAGRAEQERAATAAAETKRLAAERAAAAKALANNAGVTRPAQAVAPADRAVAAPAATIPIPVEQGAPVRAAAQTATASPGSQPELVNASLRRAETALEQLNFDAARSHLESARRLEPTNARAARLMQQISERELRYLREETVIK